MLADLCFGDTKLSVKIPAIGSYMVSNALAAVAVGKLCGLNDEQLVKGVEAYKTVGSRANVINTEDYKSLTTATTQTRPPLWQVLTHL